jgi:hypothetical protein
MDYLSRMLEYSELLRELEIGGEENLKVILKDSATYLKRVEETQTIISSDRFLSGEDKERMLEKISVYLKRVKPNAGNPGNKGENESLYMLALLAMFVINMLKSDGNEKFTAESVLAFKDELEKILGKGKE